MIAPIAAGTLINERYEIRQSLGKGGMGEVFLAYDRSTQQGVALKVVREESRQPGDDEALRQELIHARSISHPNVCRVHDLAPSPWGPILVMEYITGQTLHTHIRRKKAQGGYSADEFRRISTDICNGVAAIHAQGLVHGDLKPGNVMVTSHSDGSLGKAMVLDFGFAKERARTNARKPGAPPDGGTPHYMAPERIKSGGASQEDDVYALALTLWEMWTARVPEPGNKPRARPMREQIQFDVPSKLSLDETKQVFRCMAEDPQMRIRARHLRFFNPATMTTSSTMVVRERLDPGPPLGRSMQSTFTPGAQFLLATYATNSPDYVGSLIELSKPVITIGRRAEADVIVPEATVSGLHANVRWSNGAWSVEDRQTTNGTYAEHAYERKSNVTLLHGNEVQLGELRFRLVTFPPASPQHKRAESYLERRDGLTGLLQREHFYRALEDEAAFSEWSEAPLTIAKYELRGPNRTVSERPTILEMLAIRRAAMRVVEITETLLLSLVAVTAGKIAPLRFAVAMVGPTPQEAKSLVEQIVGQMQGMLPDGLDLGAKIVPHVPGTSVRAALDSV
jgi:eukaryotic-like serine/threonine-protein kinase